MITEIAIAAGIMAYSNHVNSPQYFIKRSFEKIMEENNLEYHIIEVKKSDYGYNVIVGLNGQGYSSLEGTRELFETQTGCHVFIEQNENLCTATISIITETLKDTTKFVPVKLEAPYEIYGGMNYKFEKLISNLAKFPHVLVSGQTGSGKTEELRMILTNSICNFTDRDLHIYFSDLSDMCDFDIFKKCSQTKGYARNIEESLKLFNYMLHLYGKRLEIYSSNECKNIAEYNQKYSSKKMNYIFVVMDEFADYFPSNKFEKDYELKVQCYELIKQLVRKARKCGIFLICGIQRPDTTVLDPSLRSGLCTKIAFSQNTDASSLVACDNTELTNIENRKGLFMFGNKREWFKSLYITDKIIKQYIKPSCTSDRSDFNKFLQPPPTPAKSDKADSAIIPLDKNKDKGKGKGSAKNKEKNKVQVG